MKDIVVGGIGVICNIGTNVEEVWNTLSSDKAVEIVKEAIPFESKYPSVKRRRMSTYSDMTTYTADEALKDGSIVVSEVGEVNVGTIFTTGYGTMESNLNFNKKMLENDPDLCSPTVFANTVLNSNIGNTCIQLGVKGVSTSLQGSDNWSYSEGLITKGDASYILTGSTEEYSVDLMESLQRYDQSSGIDVKESSVIVLLTEVSKSKNTYAHYLGSITGDLGGYPVIDLVDGNLAYETITDMAKEMQEKYQFDTIFTSSNGSYFDEIENKALTDVFGQNMTYVHNVKRIVGETLGCAYNMNMFFASLCIKHGKLPVMFDKNEKQVKTVLVCSYDLSGNYYMAVLAK